MRVGFSLIVVFGLLLAGCAVPTGGGGGNAQLPTEQVGAVDTLSALESQARQLPGVQVNVGETLVLNYPAGSLFASEAVLPTVRAPEYLQALSRFLQQNRSWNWQAKVRASTANGQTYDLSLAAERKRLLEKMLQLPDGSVEWELLSASGSILEIRPAEDPR